MSRSLIFALIASAGLTTSLGAAPRDARLAQAPGSAEPPAEAPTGPPADETLPDTEASIPVANADPDARAAVTATDASGLSPEDEAIVVQILDRLAIRHTALPARERRALARTIVREARAHDLDPDLVVAVIEVESAGYHLAVSQVGAMGLMQLLPTTGAELADKLGIDWHGDDTLFDPTVNVKLGTAYLRELADRYGDVSIALAAYNWGPARIDRRLRRGATVPSRYIEQVMRAYDHGTTRLAQSS